MASVAGEFPGVLIFLDQLALAKIRELKQLIECLHEQTKVNTEMVRQPIGATKDNACNARKAQKAAEAIQ